MASRWKDQNKKIKRLVLEFIQTFWLDKLFADWKIVEDFIR